MSQEPDPASADADGGDRALTGLSGLDDVLARGLPRNRLYLVEGTSGMGKTTLRGSSCWRAGARSHLLAGPRR